MSSTQIEREFEEVDNTEIDENAENSEIAEIAENNEIAENSENTVTEPVTPEYASKSVKKLTKNERDEILDKFEKGIDDPYFKVIKMSNGRIRVTKRKNPIINDIEQAQQSRTAHITNRASRLTNEQLLMEHVIDLEKRVEAMRLKHKKLKKRYNDLENSIYEDVNDNVNVIEPETQETQETQESQESKQQYVQETQRSQVTPQTTRRLRKTTWRDAIDYL